MKRLRINRVHLSAAESLKHCGGTYGVELAGVVIAVVDADLAAKDARVAANGEVVWHERAAIGLENDLALEECTLRSSRVDLLWLSDHDGLVLQVVENRHLSNLEVLKSALDDVLLEVTVESEDL